MQQFYVQELLPQPAWGLVCEWDANTANVHDSVFQPMIAQFEEEMVVLTDHGFHSKGGDPSNMKVCARGTWNVRMLVERVFSMLHTVCHLKHLPHRVWSYLAARLAFCMAAFNILACWAGTAWSLMSMALFICPSPSSAFRTSTIR